MYESNDQKTELIATIETTLSSENKMETAPIVNQLNPRNEEDVFGDVSDEIVRKEE